MMLATTGYKQGALCLGRVTVGLSLVVAGAAKIVTPGDFALAIARYGLVAEQYNLLLADVIPWPELVVGVCLLFGFWTRSAALLAAVMFAVFLWAMATAVLNGVDVPCGCFGAMVAEVTLSVAMARTGALLLGALALALSREMPACAVDRFLGESR